MNYDPRPHPLYAFHYLLGVLFHHLAPEAVNTLPKVLPSTLRWHGTRASLYPSCGLHIVFRFFDFTLIASNLPGSVANWISQKALGRRFHSLSSAFFSIRSLVDMKDINSRGEANTV